MKKAPYIARTRGTRTFPWRVVTIDPDDRALLENNLAYQLAAKPVEGNASWVRPGKISWEWWHSLNIYGVGFRSGVNTATYKYYIDFAAKYGIDYILLDEGRSVSTLNIKEPCRDIDLGELIRYGREKGVGVVLWTLWNPMKKDLEGILDTYRDWGVKGIKIDFMQRSDQEMVRFYDEIARAAFDYARRNGKTRVTVVTKANILKKTDGKFTALCHEVAADYPEITVDDYYIDIMAANLVNERVRGQFQVLLLPNLYGDIITDEAAQIQGGVGTAGSANIGDRFAMFEAIHGSAPRLMELGLGEFANPQSILKAEAMLLRHICRPYAAERLERALEDNPLKVTGDRDGATCREYTDMLLEML